jgi:preprotein translocase subunit SecA
VSLEDDIMRIFGGDQIAKLMTTLKMPENVPLEHAMVTKAIEQAQVKVESFHFDSRKHLVEYDDVMNKQREIIYKKRRQTLEIAEEKGKKEELKEKMLQILAAEAEQLVNLQVNPETKEIDYEGVVKDFAMMVPFDPESQKRIKKQVEKLKTDKEVNEWLYKTIESTYQQREKQVGEPLMREVERFVMLSTIDNLWVNHLDAIDDLREGIGLRGYAQRDPLVEYKTEAFNMFEKLMGSIDYEVARRIFRVQIAQRPQPQQVPPGEEVHPEADKPDQVIKPTVTTPTPVPQVKADKKQSDFAKAFAKAGSKPSPSPSRTDPVGKKQKKIGRNDPCWCGSKKKWKKCHYPDKG